MGMEATLRHHMLTLIDLYADHMVLAPSTVSGWAHGDPRFYEQLRHGRPDGDGERTPLTFSANTYDRIVATFASEWPAGLKWPKGIRKIPLHEVRVRPRKPRSVRTTPQAMGRRKKAGRSRSRKAPPSAA